MSNPYLIQGPACINFSGGRTSAYMLRQIQLAGSLEDPSVVPVFADTGKERPETYKFILQFELEFGVDVKVVRYPSPVDQTPFEAMIRKERYLPNPKQRICTDRLKIIPAEKFFKKQFGDEYQNVLGIRADEQHRAAKIRRNPLGWRSTFPLLEAGVTKQVVRAKSRAQSFDLELQDWEGNCDLCFMKGSVKRARIVRDSPERAQWWIDMEKLVGARFRKDSITYEKLLQRVQNQFDFFDQFANPQECQIDDLGDCFCGD